MTTQSNTPAGWYADPHGTPQLLRWWDGSRWTEHTHAGTQPAAPQQQPAPQQPAPGVPRQAPPQPYGSPGQQMPPQGMPPQHQQENIWELGVDGPHDPSRVRAQVQSAGAGQPVAGGGGTLFSEPVLVVNQKAKLIEVVNEYAVFDRNGNQIGSVAEIGQSALKKAVRFLSSYDQFMTHKLEVRDRYGQPVLHLTRPAKFIKSKMLVDRPDGTHLGEIVQQNAIGKIRFGFMVDGRQIGAIKAENWRAWNFAVVDHAEHEIARITKTWEGLLKAAFTTADNYVLQIHQPLPDPLLSMVVASALTVDTALKQDSR